MSVRATSPRIPSFDPPVGAGGDAAASSEAAAAFMSMVAPLMGGQPTAAASLPTPPQTPVDTLTGQSPTPETAAAGLALDPKGPTMSTQDEPNAIGSGKTTGVSTPGSASPTEASADAGKDLGLDPNTVTGPTFPTESASAKGTKPRHGLSGLGTALRGLLGGVKQDEDDEPGWRAASRVRGAAGVVGTRAEQRFEQSGAAGVIRSSENAVKAAELSAVRLLSTAGLAEHLRPTGVTGNPEDAPGGPQPSPALSVLLTQPDAPAATATASTAPTTPMTPAPVTGSPVIGAVTPPPADPTPVTTALLLPEPLVDGLRTQTMIWAARMSRSGDGMHRVTMRLHPGELGTLEVTVLVAAGQVDVTLAADSAGTRSALSHALHDLRQSLSDQGATVGQLDVRDFSGGGTHAGNGSSHTDIESGRSGSLHDGRRTDATDAASSPSSSSRVRALRTDVTVDIDL